MKRALVALLALASFGLIAAGCPPPVDHQPSFPIHAAFYYPWFPEAWHQQGFDPFTNYHPSLGFYDDRAAITDAHIAAMRYGGQDAAIASWWGQGTATDGRVPALLEAAASTPFRWTLYFEQESLGNPSAASISTALGYIDQHYGHAKAYLRVQGHPVIFVYADSGDGCATAARWADANANGRFYVVLKVFPGYLGCAAQPQAWHQYAPAVRADSQPGQSFAISPGFYKRGEIAPRLPRDPAGWRSTVDQMVASGTPWQLVTTFNEWGEGTSVESAQEWATSSGDGSYLDALHQVLGGT